LSRSLICASPAMPDEGGEPRGVRLVCAMLEPQSANVTIHTAVSLFAKVIVIPFNKNSGLRG
jgi:hypothetical protein